MTPLDRALSFFAQHSGAKLISIIIAVVLWIVVLGSRNVEVTKEIPLEVQTPNELVISTDLPEKVTFRLSGPKAFLRAILDRREDPIRVNLTGAKAGVVTYRFFADNIRLPIGVKVLAVTPPSLVVRLEPVKRKEVPVRLDLQGTPPEGYQITRTEVKPATIKIRGPESTIDAVSEVTTLPIDLNDARQTIDLQATLDLARQGLQVEGSLPQVRVEVTAIQANFKIRNVELRVLSKHRSKVDESNITVYVRVDPTEIGNLDRKKVYAEVDLQDKNKGRYTERVKVTLPPNVGLVRVIPERVKVTLY